MCLNNDYVYESEILAVVCAIRLFFLFVFLIHTLDGFNLGPVIGNSSVPVNYTNECYRNNVVEFHSCIFFFNTFLR